MSDIPTNPATIVPGLRYHDALGAIDWLARAFGFERWALHADGVTVHHALMTYGNGMIMLSSARDDDFSKFFGPPDGRPSTMCAYLIVSDVDAHHARAVAAGAKVIAPLATKDYGRDYTCQDLEGNVWSFGSYDPWASKNQ